MKSRAGTATCSRCINGVAAGAAVLAWIAVQKYCNHLPLYRQEAIFQREGLRLPRQTTCDYLWSFTNPEVEGVVFRFKTGRGADLIVDDLIGIEGYLVGDGLSTNKTVATRAGGDVVLAGCWAHALRKFRDALKDSSAVAKLYLHDIGEHYTIEREADEAEATPEERLRLRQECATARRSCTASGREGARADLLRAPREVSLDQPQGREPRAIERRADFVEREPKPPQQAFAWCRTWVASARGPGPQRGPGHSNHRPTGDTERDSPHLEMHTWGD